MEFRFETAPEEYACIELDDKILGKIPGGPAFGRAQLEHAFSLGCRVPDVWRYTLQVRHGEPTTMHPVTPEGDAIPSRYPDRPASAALKYKEAHEKQRLGNVVSVRLLLLLLESPHDDEYLRDKWGRLVPQAPAQKRKICGTGHGIAKCWPPAIEPLELPEGDYLVILANPVPYQCSLATVGPGPALDLRDEKVQAVRDHVWTTLFALESVKRDFRERLLRYQPDIILNCCTKNLQMTVTDAIRDTFRRGSSAPVTARLPRFETFGTRLYSTYHPSAPWHFGKYKGLPVLEWPLPDGGPRLLPLRPMTRKKNKITPKQGKRSLADRL